MVRWHRVNGANQIIDLAVHDVAAVSLILNDEIDTHSMWMKNTYISLDMVFARPDGTVSSVIHGTQPLSLASQSSIEPVKYVLELNAGVARRYNIGSKSRILWEPQDAVGQQ